MKKGAIKETVYLILGLIIATFLIYFLISFFNYAKLSFDDTSVSQFNMLVSEIEELKEECFLDKRVLYLARNHVFISFDKEDDLVKPDNCYQKSCLCLCLGDKPEDCIEEDSICMAFDVNIFRDKEKRVLMKGRSIKLLNVLKEKNLIKISEEEVVKKYNVPVDPLPYDQALLERLKDLEPYISAASDKFGVEEELIKAIIVQESDANIDFLESKGKVGPECKTYCGLMQVSEAAVTESKKCGLSYSFNHIKPKENLKEQILVGSCYFKLQLDAFNSDEKLALAAYNKGAGNVKHWKSGCGKEYEDWDEIVKNIKEVPIYKEGYLCELPKEVIEYVPSVLTYRQYFKNQKC